MAIEIISGRKTGIRYVGEGEPALLLHCSLAHSGAWGGVMAGLADRLSMVAIDLPGHGTTEFDPALDIQDQACETAIAILERINEPAHLIGHSFGATVAMRCAVERPDLVATLSIYEPVYISMLAKADPETYSQEAKDSEVFGTHLLQGNWRGAANAFLDRWGGSVRFDDMPKAQQNYMIKTIPMILENHHSVIEDRAGPVSLENVSEISMPCLLMEGAKSPATIRALNDLLENNLPNVTRKVFATAGHMGPINHAPDVAKSIRRFLFGDET